MKYNVLVEGPYLTQSGYGEHARLVLDSLRHREDVEGYGLPLEWGKTSWISSDDEDRKWYDEVSQKLRHTQPDKFDVHVFVGVPNELTKKAEKAICVTAGIEVDRVSPQWLVKSHEIDKTNANQENTEKETLECACPVEVIPYSIRKYQSDKDFDKVLSDKLEYDFNFLVVAQWGPRKNIENTISWFVEEFKEEKVGLLLKTNYSRSCNMDFVNCQKSLSKLLKNIDPNSDRLCKVVLLHGDLQEEQLGSLYTNKKIKAIISATHGEGFGLPLFEAACHELPVCATNATGHVDFLYAKNKKGNLSPHFAPVEFYVSEVPDQFIWEGIIEKQSRWCYPTAESFKQQMRLVYKDYRKYKSFAKKLNTNIKEIFSEKAVMESMASAIIGDLESELEELDLKVFS